MRNLQQPLLRDQTLYSSISKHWHFHTLTDIHLTNEQKQSLHESGRDSLIQLNGSTCSQVKCND